MRSVRAAAFAVVILALCFTYRTSQAGTDALSGVRPNRAFDVDSSSGSSSSILHPPPDFEFYHVIDYEQQDRISVTVYGANRHYRSQIVEIMAHVCGRRDISHLARSMNLIVHDRDTGEVLPPIGFSVERTANDTTAILKTSINCGYNVKLLKVWFRFAFMNEMNESADLWAPVKVPIGDRFIEMSPRIPEAYPEFMIAIAQQTNIPFTFRYGLLIHGEGFKMTRINAISAKHLDSGLLEIEVHLSQNYHRKLTVEVLNGEKIMIAHSRVMAVQEPDNLDLRRKFHCIVNQMDFLAELDIRLTFELYVSGDKSIPLLVIRRKVSVQPSNKADSHDSILFDMDAEEELTTTAPLQTRGGKGINGVDAVVQMKPLPTVNDYSTAFWYPQLSDEFGGVFKFRFIKISSDPQQHSAEQTIIENFDCTIISADAVKKALKCSADLFISSQGGMSSKTYFHGIIKLRLTDMMTKKFLTVTSPSEQLNLDDRRRIKLRWVWSIENTVTLAKADLCVRLWESMMARFSICSQFMIRFLRRGVAYIDRQDGQMDGDYYDRTYIPLIYSSTTGADDPHALLPQVGYFAPDYGVVEKSLVRISEVQVIINGEEELCISFHATDSSEHPTFKLAVSDHLAGFNWLLYGSGDLSVSEMSSFAGSTVLSTTGTSGRYYSVCIPSSDAGVDVNATLVSIQISVDMFLSDNWPFRAQYEFQDVPVSRPMHFIAKANANEGFDCKLKYHLANGEEVGYVGASSGLPDSFDVIETVDSQVIDRSAKLMTVELKVITKHPQSRRMRLRFKVFALDTSNTEAHSRVRRKRLATGHQPPKFKLLKTRPQDPRWSRDLIQTAVEMPAECALIYVEVCLVRGRLWWQRLLPIYRSPPLTVYPGDDSTINSHYIPLHTSWLSRQWMAVKRRLSKRTKQ